MRVKSKWHNKSRPKSTEEIAGALAFIVWRIASNAVQQMYNKGFNFSSNAQQLAVIGEFIGFLTEAAERLARDHLDESERQKFVGTLARKLVDTLNDNLVEELGPGDYREGVIEKLNERFAHYAELKFIDGEPGYQFLRYFGSRVDEIMGGQENRWVMEQVVEIEAPEAFKTLRKGLGDLLPQSTAAE